MTEYQQTDWVDIGTVDDIPVRGARVVKSAAMGCIGVFRTALDEVFALKNSCPHKGGPLSEGIVHGRSITCPLHNLTISLETGMAEGGGEGQTPTIPVRIKDGRLFLLRSARDEKAA